MKKEEKLLINKKGFTLVEIIGVVIILGIIAIVAVPYFTRSMNTFRDDYYNNMVKNIETTGIEFFQDNSKYLPSKYLNSSKVTLNTLISQNYIDDVLDYEGNKCSTDSYVIVIRKAKNEYSYKVCMKCPEDEFDNTSEKECDKAWEDNSEGTILVELGEPGDKYIYKDSTREEVIEKLTISGTIVKRNHKNEVLEEVSGEEQEEIPELLPVNIDIVDTSKAGEYTVEYEYEETKKEAVVTVYENSEPNITMIKENKVRKNNVTATTQTEVSSYNGEGEWAQKLTINFTTSEEENELYNKTGTNISRYQWKRGDRWLDFCTADGSNNCTREIEEEMNETVYFRSIDNEGNISRVSKGYIIRIDNTKPTCTLTTSGTMGDNGWYRSNVNVTFASYQDNIGSNSVAVSGIKRKSITLGDIGTLETGKQTADTKGVEWYGYVEDNAENFNICNVIFKKDSTSPTITWDVNDSLDADGSYHSNDGITVIGTCHDVMSGVESSYVPKSSHIAAPANPGTASMSCMDNAGNTYTESSNFYVKAYYSSNCTKCGCALYNQCSNSDCGTYCSSYGNTYHYCSNLAGSYCNFTGCLSSNPHPNNFTCTVVDSCCLSYSNKSCRTSACGCETCGSCYNY